jgi:hypothetical protein
MARRWRAALCLLAACAAAAAQQERSGGDSGGEECAWSSSGSGGDTGADARPCGIDAGDAASQALHALRRELDAAAARIAAERAALDDAAARVRALRASLAGCGDAAADAAAEDAPPPRAPPPLLSPLVRLSPHAGGADASSVVALVPALLGGGAGAPAADDWAHRLTVAARPPPGWGSLLPLLSALRVLPPAHASALLTLPPEPMGGAPPRFIAVGGAPRNGRAMHACVRETCMCAHARTLICTRSRASAASRLAGPRVRVHARRRAGGGGAGERRRRRGRR